MKPTKTILLELPSYQYKKLNEIKDDFLFTWNEFIGEFCLDILQALFLGIVGHEASIQYDTDEALKKVLDIYCKEIKKRYEKGLLNS
ncbi:MAG: hypothetical protein JSV20_05250 [Candidatus Bathyarchaeota archaeon]|nr:MAG: hypothetical protein JSV20_05250 [Candidatus Bathyarchaeota archaeon]